VMATEDWRDRTVDDQIEILFRELTKLQVDLDHLKQVVDKMQHPRGPAS
jgi:hypothetical protein